MRMPMKWTVVLACLAIAVVLVERSRVMYRASASAQVATESLPAPCPEAPPAAATATEPADLPAVAQPGGIDPMGATRAIRDALQDCP
jgi:hypothetical protein